MIVKICGINDPAGYDAAVEAGADHVGFVFFAASPRHVTAAQAAGLAARGGAVSHVGLFVSPEPDAIASVLAEMPLDVLQIYGPPVLAAALRARFGRPVWHARGVAGAADLPTGLHGADGFVIEAKPPPGATRPGGNATALDWGLLAGWVAPGPWLLAGGLTPRNVGDAIRASGARGVDVSSGVESAPGVKSPDLVRKFVFAARRAGEPTAVPRV